MMVQIKSPKHCIKFISKHPRLIWFVIGHLIWGTASLSVGGLKTSALRFKPQEQLQMMQDSLQDVLYACYFQLNDAFESWFQSIEMT